jgi:hypothetical protein
VRSFVTLPLGFEQNLGQVDDNNTRFLSRASGYSLYLAHGEMRVVFNSRTRDSKNAEIVRIGFAGGNQNAGPRANDLLHGVSNY